MNHITVPLFENNGKFSSPALARVGTGNHREADNVCGSRPKLVNRPGVLFAARDESLRTNWHKFHHKALQIFVNIIFHEIIVCD